MYVFFAGYGLLSYDANGRERWRLPLGPFTNFHGMGASPVLAEGKVLMICDQDQGAFLLGVDQNTGKPIWRAERPDMVHSFSTPIVHRTGPGRSEIIVPGSYQMTSYDVSTGELLWQVHGLTYQVKSVPVLANDTVYGLAGAVWTNDIQKAIRVAKKVKSGMVWINTFGKLYQAGEMGGFKQSGVGRQYGLEGLWEFTEMKHINVQL